MRLIDAEDLDFYFCDDVDDCRAEVDNTVTINPEDLRPKGRWVDEYGGKYENLCYRCSLCKKKALYNIKKIC